MTAFLQKSSRMKLLNLDATGHVSEINANTGPAHCHKVTVRKAVRKHNVLLPYSGK
jgi:hypothetical protein